MCGKFLPALFGTVCVASASFASAQEQSAAPTYTIDVTEKGSYYYKEFNATASKAPVTQIDFSAARGAWSGMVWGSIGRGYGNELDFDVFNTQKIDTFVPILLQFSAQDYFMNGPGGMFSIKNNNVELYADAFVPFAPAKDITIGPMFRVVQVFALGSNYVNHTIIEPGIRGTWTVNDRFSVEGEFRETLEPRINRRTNMYFGGVSYALTKNVVVSAGVEGMTDGKTWYTAISKHF